MVKTRFMIISDTHNATLYPANSLFGYREGLPEVDVLLHCGDMTEEGGLHEYENTLDMLGNIKAAVKLVIAGNHDITLDSMHEAGMENDMYARALAIMTGEKARNADVTYLTEGSHKFALKNGATFTIYTSPYQPAFCDWAFQYASNQDRFNPSGKTTKYHEDISRAPIPDFGHVDIVMTHGPPLGHLDRTPRGSYYGCRNLQRAIARSKPRLHCFGHIHEGYGAERTVWSGVLSDYDDDGSRTSQAPVGHSIDGLNYVDVSTGSHQPLDYGHETLLINAAIMNATNQRSTSHGSSIWTSRFWKCKNTSQCFSNHNST
ncbi:hypothetical protein MRB53_038037 [Persea americana]|nr:hypothetical protein MRB53_038037 [Persea americana]